MPAAEPAPQSVPPPPINPALGPENSLFPGTAGAGTTGTSASTPALLALPASTPGNGDAPAIDANNYRKFYTITAELRETYDSNVDTAYVNPHSSLETSLSPSILVDFPQTNSEFSARYTLDAVYYSYKPASSNDPDLSHQFVAQYRHDFSERLSLNASDQAAYSEEPNLFGSTGTPYRNGNNLSNSFTAGINFQVTPLIGTQTSYTNTLVRYTEEEFAYAQDNDENTFSETLSYSVLPKLSAQLGGIYDDITYDDVSRGYTTYTAFVGGQWQILPSLSATARGGGSYTENKDSLSSSGSGEDSISPYAALTVNWQIGERSSLSLAYNHEVTPTDQPGANGQESDRITANVSYAFSSNITSHLQAIYTYSDIDNSFISSSNLSSYTETDYAIDTGAAYHFNKYFDVDFDITISGVSSELYYRNYSRDQFSLGIRGTY